MCLGGGDLKQLSIIRPHIEGAPVHGHEPGLVSPSHQRGYIMTSAGVVGRSDTITSGVSGYTPLTKPESVLEGLG